MRVELFVNDIKRSSLNISHPILIDNTIERIKLENREKIRGQVWEVFLIRKSKMNEKYFNDNLLPVLSKIL